MIMSAPTPSVEPLVEQYLQELHDRLFETWTANKPKLNSLQPDYRSRLLTSGYSSPRRHFCQ